MKPSEFYNQELISSQNELKTVKRKLLNFSLVRLTIFFIFSISVYFTWDFEALPLMLSVVGLIIFFILISKNADLKIKKKELVYKVELNKRELVFLEGKPVEIYDGEKYIDQTHAYSSDIDLFGKKSFFQILNRTELSEGQDLLANILKRNNITDIVNRQEAIQELSNLPKWRQSFQVSAHFVNSEIKRPVITSWLKDYQSFMSKITFKISRAFSALSIIMIILYGFNVIASYWLLIVFLTGIGIVGRYVKKVNKLAIHVSQLKSVFSNYSKLIRLIEQVEFKSNDLIMMASKIVSEKEKASELLNEFSSYLNALDQRNNILFGIIGNGFLLWDCQQVYKIETWISNHNSNVEQWFEAIEYFDAHISLANFAFNYPEFNYPTIVSDSANLLDTNELGHVMIGSAKRINNDFKISKSSFQIITGANMAGKSTFLRTVALSILSANTGLPICAKEMIYKPIKLVTSMRNTDSLVDDSSYFFSELTRLKFIVDLAENEPYFIILDEILKGTNSRDKEEGSKKLMRRLSKSKSAGLIATHDLGLCEIESELQSITNYYFDAEIINNELFFDYKMKTGICQNMNASFLLKKMDIV